MICCAGSYTLWEETSGSGYLKHSQLIDIGSVYKRIPIRSFDIEHRSFPRSMSLKILNNEKIEATHYLESLTCVKTLNREMFCVECQNCRWVSFYTLNPHIFIFDQVGYVLHTLNQKFLLRVKWRYLVTPETLEWL